VFPLSRASARRTTASSFACWGGSSLGIMVIAPLGHALAHTPQPVHLSTSIILFSVSVAPTGQTYRHRQSFVHSLRFLTANSFIRKTSLPSSQTSSPASYRPDRVPG